MSPTRQLDMDLLSEREKEILNLAIEGLTDQQIGNKLNISASTVNSYWVRIRGKLGHLSRTELVSRIVQQKAVLDSNSLEARIAALEQQLAEARQDQKNCDEARMLRSAMDLHPEACALLDGDGVILLKNQQFDALFGERCETEQFNELFTNGRPGPIHIDLSAVGELRKLGLDRPVFALAHDGRPIRVYVFLRGGTLDGKKVFSCVIRRFNDELRFAQDRASLIMEQLR